MIRKSLFVTVLALCAFSLATGLTDVLGQCLPNLYAPGCSSFHISKQFMVLVKAAEVKILVDEPLTATEGLVWDAVRSEMRENFNSDDCASFMVQGKEAAKCCKLGLGSMTKVAFCTYMRVLAKEPRVVPNGATMLSRGVVKPKPSSKVQICDCKRAETGGGICYEMPLSGSSYCTTRPCSARYFCVSAKTGLKCIRKKVTSRVVRTGPATCTKKLAKSWSWVPYTLRGY